ncbi:AMP-binding protein, partial [Gammaproteobacteria bacterium]|nr:AMP-binding protein [Gammaproteobacteria bacterium]
LNDVLMLHAKNNPNRIHIYLKGEEEKNITHADLFLNSQKIAITLLKNGLVKGDKVAIMLPTGHDFFYSFFGVLLAGGVPVPIYPPAKINQIDSYIQKEAKILNNCSAIFLISFNKVKVINAAIKTLLPGLKSILTMDSFKIESNDCYIDSFVNTNDVALIQYTSGSTGSPKGIVLSHMNILENIKSYGEALNITSEDVCVSWLPLYHDLGLIGNWLGSLYFGVPLILYSPLDFLMRPEKWLWAIHNHRGTISASPNFGYELCVNRISPDKLEGLDLNSWRVAINGAEPIQLSTLDKFCDKFKKYGFRKESMLPVYGLAETALGLTATPLNRGVKADLIDRNDYEIKQIATKVNINSPNKIIKIVSCGMPLPRHNIRIVDNNGLVCNERVVGALEFNGPSSMLGYYNNSKATEEVFDGIWVKTGDIGYISDCELYVTGRLKDIIIKSGRNFVPSDIEDIVSNVDGIRKGCVIAFSDNRKENSTEKLVVVSEIKSNNYQQISQDIKNIVSKHLNITVDDVVLLKPGSISKTSSGKLQRAACKKMYFDNKLNINNGSLLLQFIKLSTKVFFSKIINILANVGKVIYTLYIFFWVVLTLPFVWLFTQTGKKNFQVKCIKYWFKFLIKVSLIPIEIKNKNYLKKNTQYIYVANHCSYLDSILLMMVLPENTCYVVKKSLFKIPFVKTIFKKIGCMPVNKYNSSEVLNDFKKIEEKVSAGVSVLIFPEGSFAYSPGLRPFKTGGFKLAVNNDIPVIPIAINGTRQALRGNGYLFSWNPLKVIIGKSLKVVSPEWESIVTLKKQAFSFILENCQEPNLDFIIVNQSLSKTKY